MSEKTEMNLFMGPQHPSMHGLWAIRLTIDGETIIDGDAQIGYLHRGYEKLLTNRSYEQGIPICDRLCYVESHSWSTSYTHSIEGIYNIQIPDKAKWARILTLELQRIASHCLWLAAMSVDIGALTMLIYPMNAREIIINMLEAITGARMTYNYARIGGVAADLPFDTVKKLERSFNEFQRLHFEFLDLLEEAQIFRIRTQGIGVLTKEQALNYGTTGPVLRASGVEFDVRKNDPYFGYDELKFNIPTRTEGDCYARYRVRIEEIQEAMKLCWQALDKYNELNASDPFKLDKLPRRPNEGEVYRRIETSRGEGGFFIQSDGSTQPYRVRIKSPVFNNLQVLIPLIKGGKLADIPAVMGSIDLCVGDLDR
ncbi:MAG: NADH-quinone oxidoreductase subunit NuoD [Candidatus Heimdallarchaeota archaeon]|nr:NADH-quinone oxidoreductase subunit NuoD [Candidatus Heimdallarchaeota archaeon]MDH5647420.1 NADH-quinone oxidoreductase subunit NuoD [Candidatus Heimdallarchaeota archaeon]